MGTKKCMSSLQVENQESISVGMKLLTRITAMKLKTLMWITASIMVRTLGSQEPTYTPTVDSLKMENRMVTTCLISFHCQSQLTKGYPCCCLCRAKVPKNLDVDTSSGDFILQNNVEKVLKKPCNIFKLDNPNLCCIMRRPSTACSSRAIVLLWTQGPWETPLFLSKSLGNMMMLPEKMLLVQELCKRIGKQIRDFNFYNVQTLETKVQTLKDANMQLKLQLAILEQAKSTGEPFVQCPLV